MENGKLKKKKKIGKLKKKDPYKNKFHLHALRIGQRWYLSTANGISMYHYFLLM